MKKFLTVLLAAFIAFGASACADNGRGGENVLNVTVWLAGFGKEWIEEMGVDFEAETGIHVDVYADPSAPTGITQAFNVNKADNYDDLYFSAVTNQWLAWAASGKLADLSEAFTAEERAGYEKLGVYEGKKYVMNFAHAPIGIVYNHDYLTSLGYDSFPTTLEGLLEYCDKINDSDLTCNGQKVKPLSYGGTVSDLNNLFKCFWAQGNGGSDFRLFFNQNSTQPTESAYINDSVLAAMNALYDVLAPTGKTGEGAASNAIDGCASLNNVGSETSFLNGYSAFTISGSWFVSEMKDTIAGSAVDYRFANIPNIDKNDAQLSTVMNVPAEVFFVPEKAYHKKNAIKFLQFITKEENLIRMHQMLDTPLAYEYEMTEEQQAALSPWGKQVNDLVSRSRCELPASESLYFWAGALNAPFRKSTGAELDFYDAVSKNTYTKAQFPQVMEDSWAGIQINWEGYNEMVKF